MEEGHSMEWENSMASGIIQAAGKGALETADIYKSLGIGEAQVSVSGQRVVNYQVMESAEVWNLSDEDVEVLLRIVEAEAGSEDEDGRLLVANVVLNRVASDMFPDTVPDVVFQQGKGVTQFSPVASGSYYRVKVSEKTVSAVERALKGEDISQGALYFASRRYASGSKMRWFDEKLTFLFQHGGHEFFK
ncbi:MAG: cell wall hydrolase [Acetatifactor sp.]|nr:cell wall hydrolase [Acetatifactor sp.]